MNPDLQKMLSQLRHLPLVSPKYCSNCGQMHIKDDFAVSMQETGGVVMHIGCHHCGVMYLLRMQPGSPGISMQRLEVLTTDISAAEFQKFAGKPGVAKEEALDVYQDMQTVEDIAGFLALLERGN